MARAFRWTRIRRCAWQRGPTLIPALVSWGFWCPLFVFLPQMCFLFGLRQPGRHNSDLRCQRQVPAVDAAEQRGDSERSGPMSGCDGTWHYAWLCHRNLWVVKWGPCQTRQLNTSNSPPIHSDACNGGANQQFRLLSNGSIESLQNTTPPLLLTTCDLGGSTEEKALRQQWHHGAN